MYTKAERRLMSRVGALRQHAMSDGQAGTQAARAAWMARFEHEVDPDGRMEPWERATRARAARTAYMLELSIKSSRARRELGEAGR